MTGPRPPSPLKASSGFFFPFLLFLPALILWVSYVMALVSVHGCQACVPAKETFLFLPTSPAIVSRLQFLFR